MRLKIEWSHDDYDCEQCGGSSSTGATVYLDDKIIIDAPAHAYCFDSIYVEEGHILWKLCEALGIEVEGLYDGYEHTGAEGDEWPNDD